MKIIVLVCIGVLFSCVSSQTHDVEGVPGQITGTVANTTSIITGAIGNIIGMLTAIEQTKPTISPGVYVTEVTPNLAPTLKSATKKMSEEELKRRVQQGVKDRIYEETQKRIRQEQIKRNFNVSMVPKSI